MVTVMVNLSARQVPVKYTAKALKGIYTNYFSNKKEALPKQLKAWEYKVYVD